LQKGTQSRLPGSRAIEVYPPAQILEGATLPPDVRDLPKPPARLFLHGKAPLGPRVAIVGTREPTAEALSYGEELARQLADRGVAVLSGGAKGIDAGAHRGALRAAGVTLVVAPSSFDRPYPAEHRELFEEIVAAGGGYLSRFAQGVEARQHRFLERNALLAALCHVLVLVEAPLRSGARNAAAWARRLGRPCFVVPSAPWNERGRGCIAELQLGARLLAEPDDVLGWIDEHVRRLPPARDASGPGGDAARYRADPVSTDLAPIQLGPSGAALMAAPTPAALSPAALSPAALSPAALSPAAAADTEKATRAAVLGALESGARYIEQLADGLVRASHAELNHAILSLLLSGHIARAPDGELTITRR
jgi:DNA processing protein